MTIPNGYSPFSNGLGQIARRVLLGERNFIDNPARPTVAVHSPDEGPQSEDAHNPSEGVQRADFEKLDQRSTHDKERQGRSHIGQERALVGQGRSESVELAMGNVDTLLIVKGRLSRPNNPRGLSAKSRRTATLLEMRGTPEKDCADTF